MEGEIFVLVILVGFVFPIVMIGVYTSHKQKMAQLQAEHHDKLNSTEHEHMAEELRSVKTRLEVLEAIVTDKKYQLSEEIADLKVVKK